MVKCQAAHLIPGKQNTLTLKTLHIVKFQLFLLLSIKAVFPPFDVKSAKLQKQPMLQQKSSIVDIPAYMMESQFLNSDKSKKCRWTLM